jgi:hypothetical protein
MTRQNCLTCCCDKGTVRHCCVNIRNMLVKLKDCLCCVRGCMCCRNQVCEYVKDICCCMFFGLFIALIVTGWVYIVPRLEQVNDTVHTTVSMVSMVSLRGSNNSTLR